MKANKLLLIIQTALMYLSMILVYIPIIRMFWTKDDSPIATGLMISGAVVAGACLLMAIVIYVLSFITIFKKQVVDSTQFVMIIKFILMPWYIANFVLWALIVAGMLNPFLILGIPIIIMLSVVGTYMFMLGSTLHNVCTIIAELKNKTLKPSGLLIAGMVLQFFFCLDALGAIFTFIKCQKR